MLGDVKTLALALDGHRFPRHAHEHWSIAVIDDGGGSFRCSGASYRFSAGSLTVLHPGEAHDGTAGPAGIRYRILTVPESVVSAALGMKGTVSFPSRVVYDAAVSARLNKAHRAITSDRHDPRVDYIVVDALDHLFGGHARGRVGSVASDRRSVVDAVSRYVDERLGSSITLAELAAWVELDPARLLRRFRTETGMAPYEFVVSRRVDLARRLLAEGLPIAEAAVQAGFADQSHLTRHFKRIVGVTPGGYPRH